MTKIQTYAVLISILLALGLAYLIITKQTPSEERGIALPMWSVGDRWVHRFTYPVENSTVVITNEVSGEQTIENASCYAVNITSENQTNQVVNYLSKDSLTLMATWIRYVAPQETPAGTAIESTLVMRGGFEYKFPMSVGSCWVSSTQGRIVFKLENNDIVYTNWENIAQITNSVLRKETIQVPAGKFECYVVKSEITVQAGTIIQFTWFSHTAKWWVKQERYVENNLVIKAELLSF